MTELDAQRILSAAPVSAAALIDSPSPRREPAKLSQSALDVVATEPTATAYSPIVVSGFVRTTEFILIILIGSALYFGYVGPVMQSPWAYAAAIAAISACCILTFQ